MSDSYPSEERFPLLLLFLEDGHGSSKQNKRIIIDKSRYHGITAGATSVMTQWPGHLTCWLASLLIGLTMVLIAMMMLAASLHHGSSSLVTKCQIEHLYNKKNYNRTVHLVHGPNLWSQSQLNFLELIAENFKNVDIELIVIHNNSNSESDANKKVNSTQLLEPKTANTTKENSSNKNQVRTSKPMREKRQYDKYGRLNINIGARELLNFLLHKRTPEQKNVTRGETLTDYPTSMFKTLGDLIVLFPNIKVVNTTFEDIFQHSPLRFSWKNMNPLTRIFAVRVLQLWDFAGITFDIPEIYNGLSSKDADEPSSSSIEELAQQGVKKFKKIAKSGLPSYSKLPEGLVTVDEDGFHMETKSTCHAFFGDILMNLRRVSVKTLPQDVIKQVLFSFCRRNAVDAEYCKKIGFH